MALCEPRHTRGNRGLEADLGPDSEQFSSTVRTCEPRYGRLTVGASAGARSRATSRAGTPPSNTTGFAWVRFRAGTGAMACIAPGERI